MKLFILFFLSVLAAGSTASLKSAATRANLNVGYITAGDRLLIRFYLYKPAIANTIQSQDVTYQANATTRISAVQANEIGYTQFAVPWIVAGGIGQNNVTLRVQSARGYGYDYLVEIWGR